MFQKMEDKIIVAVGNHPVLYDQSLFTYRDTNRRSQAWREVAETVGHTGRFISSVLPLNGQLAGRDSVFSQHAMLHKIAVTLMS